MSFLPKSQTVIITARSDASAFKEKIVSKKITYQGLMKMLDGEWDRIAPISKRFDTEKYCKILGNKWANGINE